MVRCLLDNYIFHSHLHLSKQSKKKKKKAGVQVIPCTDNTTMSATTLSKEYELIQKTFNLNEEEVFDLIRNGFNNTFDNSPEIVQLRRDCIREAKSILNLMWRRKAKITSSRSIIINWFFNSPIHPSTPSFIHWFIHWLIDSFNHWFHWFIYSFIHLFVTINLAQ